MSRREQVALSVVIALAMTACMDATPAETEIEQAFEPRPICAPGDDLLYYTEPYGLCGACTRPLGGGGQRARVYAGCRSNLDGTRAYVAAACAPCGGGPGPD